MKCTVMDVRILVPQRTEAGDLVSHGNIMNIISAAIDEALEKSKLWSPDYSIVNAGVLNVEQILRPPTLDDIPKHEKWNILN